MNMDYCKPYAGRDTVILDRHAADTIAEDIRAFDSQLENHFAHVIMLAEQKIHHPARCSGDLEGPAEAEGNGAG